MAIDLAVDRVTCALCESEQPGAAAGLRRARDVEPILLGDDLERVEHADGAATLARHGQSLQGGAERFAARVVPVLVHDLNDALMYAVSQVHVLIVPRWA